MDSTHNEQELRQVREANADKAQAKAANVERVTAEGDERAAAAGFPVATQDGEKMIVEKRHVTADRVILVADTGEEYAQDEDGVFVQYDALAEDGDAPAPVDPNPVDPEVPEQGEAGDASEGES